MAKRIIRRVILALAVLGFAYLVTNMDVWETLLSTLFPDKHTVVHPRASLLVLTLEHSAMVFISSSLNIVFGVLLGIFVTRKSFRAFLPLASSFASFGQIVPPIAVLALVVPILGFGIQPAILALFLFGILPVLRASIAGLEAVDSRVVEAAYGMGMRPHEVLFRVELPLAARVILGGVRTSLVINVGTATVGATIGAGGFGSPIIGGLVSNNLAYVLEGAVPAMLFALLLDWLFEEFERSILKYERRGQGA